MNDDARELCGGHEMEMKREPERIAAQRCEEIAALCLEYIKGKRQR